MVWLPEKSAQKILLTFFPFIFHKKTKLNSLQKHRNKNTLTTNKHPSLNASNIEYFGIFPSKWKRKRGRVWISLNYPLTNFKNGTPKNHLDVVLLIGS